MKMKKIIFLAFLFVLFSVPPAMANQPPGPQEADSMLLIPFVMVLLTLLGGGYAILNNLKGKKTGWIINVLVAIVFLLVALAFGAATFLAAIIFGILALQRGVWMIKWGLHARPGREKPAHLLTANHKRLIPAGAALIIITVLLMSVVLVFTDYSFGGNYFIRKNREEAFIKLVTNEIARTRLTKEEREIIKKGEKEGIRNILWKDDGFRELDLKQQSVIIEYGEGGKSFILYRLPHLPPFPYNYLTSDASYRADETGKIRMVYVNKKGKLCPPDAPIVIQIEEGNIHKTVEMIRKK